jgi:sortase (surface protein transpeptidase)
MNMKKDKIINIFLPLMIFVGLCVMFYPVVSDMWNTYRNSLLISSHKKDVNDLSKKQTEQIWNEAVNYNKNHKENFIKEDVFTNLKKHTKSKYDSYLNISKNGVMGTIVIPKINVEIPIYHGTGEKELQTGVGHMEGTSLPVGGTSSHCVLSAHRGLPSAKLFTDLDKMKKGDLFFLHIYRTEHEIDFFCDFVDIRFRIHNHHVAVFFGHSAIERPFIAYGFLIGFSCATRGRRQHDDVEPRVVFKQEHKSLSDHARSADNANVVLFHNINLLNNEFPNEKDGIYPSEKRFTIREHLRYSVNSSSRKVTVIRVFSRMPSATWTAHASAEIPFPNPVFVTPICP